LEIILTATIQLLSLFPQNGIFGNNDAEVADNPTLKALQDYFRIAGNTPRTPSFSETQ
jgi:hypothetical protein